jgi:hypothetical protein
MNEKLQEAIEFALENKYSVQEKHLRQLINNCFTIVKDSADEKGTEMADVQFFVMKFFKELPRTMNGIKRSELYAKGAKLMCLLFNKLDVDVTEKECFVFFHFRELGKFRTKEPKAFNELKSEWGQHKEFSLDEPDFLEAVRELKNHGFIGHRRGAITLNDACVFRYKMVD